MNMWLTEGTMLFHTPLQRRIVQKSKIELLAYIPNKYYILITSNTERGTFCDVSYPRRKEDYPFDLYRFIALNSNVHAYYFIPNLLIVVLITYKNTSQLKSFDFWPVTSLNLLKHNKTLM